MTLRTKLALALIAAALLPMAIAVGIPLAQADAQAHEETDLRLDRVRRQVEVLVERRRDDAGEQLRRAAADLSDDRESRRFLRQGTPAAAASIARTLAERYRLDLLELHDPQGGRLAAWPAGRSLVASLPDKTESAATLVVLESTAAADTVSVSPDTRSAGVAPRLAYVARQPVAAAGDALLIVGGQHAGASFVADIGEVIGEPVELVAPDGNVVVASRSPFAARRISGEVALGAGGWRLRLSVPAANPWRIRRALLTPLAGIAPFAILSAIIFGALLAEGIARPIRTLAARVETLAVERAGGPLSLVHERNEVRGLAMSFERLLNALVQSERQRGAAERIAAWQDVARRIAHEVKNPLSPIKLAVENLRKTKVKAPGEFDRALDEETATILEEVDSLRRLVDEFSEFARLPGPQPADCDVRRIVSQVLTLFAPRIEADGVALTVEDAEAPPTLRADAEQIGRVLKNIVSNGLDAMTAVTQRRMAITVRRIDAGQRGAVVPSVEIDIRDSGPGFTDEALRRVFEPYFTTRSGRGGSGLGMAIAYRIVTDHGGTIRAGAGAGGGAAITLRLPLAGPPAQANTEESWQPS